MIKIEKNVPLAKKINPGRPAKYPFREMEVGDSFFVEVGGMDRGQLQRSLVSSAKFQTGSGSVRTRTVTENGVVGIRAWRVA